MIGSIPQERIAATTALDRQGNARRSGMGLGTRIAALIVLAVAPPAADAQPLSVRSDDVVPREIREMYDRGLQYLASTQGPDGDWPGGELSRSESGPGQTGICLMAFLASGEDPNFGVYRSQVRKALRAIIHGQDAQTGYMGQSMYHHGFAMLALAEAYGAVDERDLWPDGRGPRTIGQALELAVRTATTAQKSNPWFAWRYSPNATDADTSVSGAILVGLLAARNAGIEVPDDVIDKAVGYFKQMTDGSGQVSYAGTMTTFGSSHARSSIATLVYAIARRKDLPEFRATLGYLTDHLEDVPTRTYREYTRYYQAQALFQGDLTAWEKWNRDLARQLRQAQQPDGSFPSQFGKTIGTGMSLLALALNYRFLPIYER